MKFNALLINLFYYAIESLKLLAKEILDLIQKRAGTTQFHIYYNKIKQQVLEVRRERKHKKAIMVRKIIPFAHLYYILIEI